MTTVGVAILIAVLSVVASAAISSPNVFDGASVGDQKPIFSTTGTRNYSIGFHLASSYGAAAVVVDHSDGTREDFTWMVHGSAAYQNVMAMLSLDASRHLE